MARDIRRLAPPPAGKGEEYGDHSRGHGNPDAKLDELDAEVLADQRILGQHVVVQEGAAQEQSGVTDTYVEQQAKSD